MRFGLGHGTENTFLIVEDPDATQPLSSTTVEALCDAGSGFGRNGLLRVVRTRALIDAGELKELPEGVEPEDWFMDYRNADGSRAEMCGNGVRVFAHWLRTRKLAQLDEFRVGTRAGAKEVKISSFSDTDALVTVEMGIPEVMGLSTARMGSFSVAGLGINLGNPHLAAVVPGLTPQSLETLELSEPKFDETFFPSGVNVEILTPLHNGHTSMRVFERGVGETRSCGSGTVAAAVAALADAGKTAGTVVVEVPGGKIEVSVDEQGSTITGPSRIIATGELTDLF